MLKFYAKNRLPNLVSYIQRNRNFNFVKLGDGELICMHPPWEKTHNCDLHPYSQDLCDRLWAAYSFFFRDRKSIVADWKGPMQHLKVQVFNRLGEPPNRTNTGLLLNTDIKPGLRDLYGCIQASSRKKIFVGSTKLICVNTFLAVSEFVEVPEIDSFSELAKTEMRLKSMVNNDAIFMFSAGMPSKCWIHKLNLMSNRLTCIDFGSSFDPIFHAPTRRKQLKTTTLRNFYGDLLHDGV